MSQSKRHVVQLDPAAYLLLKQIRARIQALEGKSISLSDAVGTALLGMLDKETGAVRKTLEEKNRRVFVNAVGDLLVKLRPDLARRFKGIAFNDTKATASLDFGDAVDPIDFSVLDPVDAVKN